ncbi:hypothetical protein PHLCEN_2v10844 [Hermanssonia centrifuga]|uniref:Uncharacterized protein n=1 Tax=Hermanssonia centrifuga TaxID=98765 RepID=A0A2R6NLV5_9APHY|nr:hypothetical protein PHLCEN_2v10844 [Hermanssonia centrifuga]
MSIVVVDDFSNNPDLNYVGDWTHLFSIGGATNNTVSYSQTVGSYIEFVFNGTGIGVAGTVLPMSHNSTPPISTYVVDDSAPTSFTSPDNATQEEFDVTFFLLNSISAGAHKLVINVTRASDDAPFLFDYLGYVPPPSATANSTSSMSSFSSPTLTPTTSATNPSSSHSSTPVGAIVGGVIGGIALLVFSAIILYFLCRRRKGGGRAYFYSSGDPTDMLQQEIKPSLVEGPVVSQFPAAPESTAPPESIDPPTVASGSYFPSTVAGSSNNGSTANLVPPPQRSGKAAQVAPSQSAVFHADSGVRFTPTGEPSSSRDVPPPPPTEIPDEIPPMYTEN